MSMAGKRLLKYLTLMVVSILTPFLLLLAYIFVDFSPESEQISNEVTI